MDDIWFGRPLGRRVFVLTTLAWTTYVWMYFVWTIFSWTIFMWMILVRSTFVCIALLWRNSSVDEFIVDDCDTTEGRLCFS